MYFLSESFGRPIFQTFCEWLLLLFSNQIFKSELFRQTVCVFILVNLINIINPSLCNVVYYKEIIQLICSSHQLAGSYIITTTVKWRVSKMKAKHHESEQVKLSKKQFLKEFWQKSVLKNSCSKSYQVKPSVKILQKNLSRSLVLVILKVALLKMNFYIFIFQVF